MITSGSALCYDIALSVVAMLNQFAVPLWIALDVRCDLVNPCVISLVFSFVKAIKNHH